MLTDKDKRLINRAFRVLEKQYAYRVDAPMFNSPEKTAEFFTLKIGGEPSEVFCVAFLNNRHQLISCDIMFRGTVDGASVHTREIVRKALEHNAASVILSHNHPSGDPEQSSADVRITQRIVEYFSFAEKGLI